MRRSTRARTPVLSLSLVWLAIPTSGAAAAALPVAFPQAGVETKATAGELVLTSVRGYSLEKTLTGESPDRAVAVYLPPSYATSPGRRYPVLHLLHGIGGTHRDWTGTPPSRAWNTIQDVMDRGIAADRIAEIIVVASDQRTNGGGSFYTNSEATGHWEDFTVIDLVDFADTTYRTLAQAASRGIAGHSMGGYGAIKLGMKHPDVFQAVYGMSSAVLGWAGDLTDENPAYELAARATPQSLNPAADFWPPSILCIAQALSPNAARPPFFVDLPYVSRDGELQKSEPAFELWTRKMPLYMVEDYTENLRRLKGLRFDTGSKDEFTHIVPTNRALSERLTELDVPHEFDEYDGDHRNRLWGANGRIGTVILPWFSRMLEREADDAPRESD